LGDQKIPAVTQPLLKEKLAHPRLGLKIAPIPVGEEPLRRVVGVLRVHAPTQNGFELIAALGVKVYRMQAGTERQPGSE
jgi:hypothetical protein